MAMRVLEAAERLAFDSIKAAVLHVPTIKPLDAQTILSEVGEGGRLVIVAENHTVIGGLGEAIGSLLMRTDVRARFRQIGLPDEFLDAGALPTLHERYRLSAAAIVETVKDWL
jgi:transketolase